MSEVVYQQQLGYNNGRYLGQSGNGFQMKIAQSFQFQAVKTCTSAEIQLMSIAGSPTGNWTYRIETDSSGVPSGTLANANASVSVVPPTGTPGQGLYINVKGSFATPFTLAANTTYWFVILCDDQTQGNVWNISYLSYSGYALGCSAYKYVYGGVTHPWAAQTDDLLFKIYVLYSPIRTISDSGGTRHWDDTASWVEGEIPIAGDDIRATATSGNLIINTSTPTLNSFDLTGYTGTLSSYYGITVGPATGTTVCLFAGTVTWTGILGLNASTGATINLTTNGKTLGSDVNVFGHVSQQDDLTINGGAFATYAQWDTNNHNISISGSTGAIGFYNQSTGTFNAGSGAINITASGASATFQGYGRTYNNLTLTGTITGNGITGSNTFNILTISPGSTVAFAHGTTQTVTSFIANGTAGSLITLNSDSTGNAFTLSKATGTSSVYYCSIKDSTATGGATWYGRSSINVSGNTGWNFGRYWVGGGSSTNWNATGNTNWSATDGGANNASIPVTGDDVFFKSSANCSLTNGQAYPSTGQINSLDMSTYTGVFTGGYGAITVGPTAGTTNCTFPSVIQTINASVFMKPATGATLNLTTNSCPVYAFSTNGGGTISQQDDLVGAGAGSYGIINTYNAIWNTNNHSLTLGVLTLGSGFTFNAGSSAVTLGVFVAGGGPGSLVVNTGGTFNAGTSVINTNSWEYKGGTANMSTSTLSIHGYNTYFVDATGLTYGTLQIATGPGTKLTFKHGVTYTVSSFIANGTSGSPVVIQSDTAGSSFTLSQSSGTNTVYYCSIKDCHATGGATWDAHDSTDVSGNTGWNFFNDRYWVGGAGTWDGTTTTNWSYTSGGTGGAIVPTSINNVYFDGNSGNGNASIVYSTPNPCCHNFICTGYTGTITNSQQQLVYGPTFLLPSSMTYSDNGGQVVFYYPGNVNLTTSGTHLPSIVVVSGTSLLLQDSLYCSTLDVRGAVVTNNNTISSNTFTSTGSLTLGSSTVNIRSASCNFEYYGSSLSCGTSTINLPNSGSLYGGNQTYYTVNFSSGAGVITGSNTFNTLNINNAGDSTGIRVVTGSTQTVSNLTTNGTSSSLAKICSSQAGVYFTISKPSGTINLSYTSIQDCYATGGATFNDTNGVNVSGNTGWNFYNDSLYSPPSIILATTQGTTSEYYDRLLFQTAQSIIFSIRTVTEGFDYKLYPPMQSIASVETSPALTYDCKPVLTRLLLTTMLETSTFQYDYSLSLSRLLTVTAIGTSTTHYDYSVSPTKLITTSTVGVILPQYDYSIPLVKLIAATSLGISIPQYDYSLPLTRLTTTAALENASIYNDFTVWPSSFTTSSNLSLPSEAFDFGMTLTSQTLLGSLGSQTTLYDYELPLDSRILKTYQTNPLFSGDHNYRVNGFTVATSQGVTATLFDCLTYIPSNSITPTLGSTAPGFDFNLQQAGSVISLVGMQPFCKYDANVYSTPLQVASSFGVTREFFDYVNTIPSSLIVAQMGSAVQKFDFNISPACSTLSITVAPPATIYDANVYPVALRAIGSEGTTSTFFDYVVPISSEAVASQLAHPDLHYDYQQGVTSFLIQLDENVVQVNYDFGQPTTKQVISAALFNSTERSDASIRVAGNTIFVEFTNGVTRTFNTPKVCLISNINYGPVSLTGALPEELVGSNQRI